ncbi:TPA: hypothetical protein ACWV6B_004480 [Salmonella enterica subsp. enterica serovar Muenchen]
MDIYVFSSCFMRIPVRTPRQQVQQPLSTDETYLRVRPQVIQILTATVHGP